MLVDALTPRVQYPRDPSSFTTLAPPISLPMSTINQVGGPSRLTDNFTAIFEVAASEYKRVTGNPLDTHPFATQLDKCDNPQSISNVLRTQAQALGAFRKGDDKLELMESLDPIVHILFTFSATLGEGIGIVSHLALPVLSFSNSIRLSAILTRQNNLRWYRRSSRCRPLFPSTLSRVCLILKFTGSKRCRGRPRHTDPPLRAHSLLPSTSERLYWDPTHE